MDKELSDEDEKLQKLYDVENAAAFGEFDKQTSNAIGQQAQIVSKLYDRLTELQQAKIKAHSEIGKFMSSIPPGKWGDEYKE